MHLSTVWVLLMALITNVIADVSIYSPALGKLYDASGGSVVVPVKWTEDDDGADSATSLSKVTKYAIVLCTGPNVQIKPIKTFTSLLDKGSLTYDATIQSTMGPNGYYYIQVYAQYGSGYTIHYLNRFALTGMSGPANTFTYPASYFSVTGAAPTPQIAAGAEGTTLAVDSRSFTVPYTLQTGKTRYAPMQMQPGTAITYTMYSTRHETSAYTPYTSLSPSPNVYSTITPGWSYKVTSLFNTAAVAEYPTYFYPALLRVQQASLSAARKRRWLD